MNKYSFEAVEELSRSLKVGPDDSYAKRVSGILRGFAIFDGIEGRCLPIALALDRATAELIVNALNGETR